MFIDDTCYKSTEPAESGRSNTKRGKRVGFKIKNNMHGSYNTKIYIHSHISKNGHTSFSSTLQVQSHVHADPDGN